MRILKRGVLVSLEGIDGAGKSTLIKLLSDYLYKDQIDHLTTKEPGGSLLGTHIKNMLHESATPMCPKAEYLLFAADRAQHMHDLVLPALAQHKLVISDRMADSSLAYQGYGRELDKDMIQQINSWTMNKREPDLIFFIQVPIAIAVERITARGNMSSFEQQITFLEKVEKGFTLLFSQKKTAIFIDGTKQATQVAHDVYNHLKEWLCQHNL